ncbi:MAG: ThiF family adenylyltransferase [Candidatus Omnitrophica bacterium]|nr:ThiF family adenylyltransferase [Candidatus Omnitrophota bacterium]
MDNYEALTNRNIGFITQKEQELLKGSCVAIFGAGGLGGVVAELACRMGIGRIKLIDHSTFEPTNLNRQIFCFNSTLDKNKIDVTEKFLKDINLEVKIEKYPKEEENNIDEILKDVNVALLCVDKVRACILISRKTREKNIPLVESWAIPYGNVRVFTKDTPSLEEAYRLPSLNKELKLISEAEFKNMDLKMLQVIARFPGIKSFYNTEAIIRMTKGENPTFAPCVWLNSVLMSLEAVKILLGRGKIALAPEFVLFDPFSGQIPK